MSENDGGRWWRPGARTARHAYYAPTTKLQGVVLFALIALLGLVALLVAGWKVFQRGEIAHDDATLGAIGFFCLTLGFCQSVCLVRRR